MPATAPGPVAAASPSDRFTAPDPAERGLSSARSPVSNLRRYRFSSRDEDEITEFMRAMYIGNRSEFAAASGGARFDNATVETTGLAADRVRSTIDYRQTTDPFDYFLSFTVRGGTVRVVSGNDEVVLRDGDTALCPVGTPVHFDIADMDLNVLRIPMRYIDQIAEELTGVPVGLFRFEAMTPVSPAMQRHWRATAGLASAALAAPDSPMSADLLRAETIRTVAVAALHTFPNTAIDAHLQTRGGAGAVAPAAVRRAVAYIEANAHLPVTLSDIAAAARTGPRALQYGFHQHHQTTPMGYLRRVRLRRVHRDLQAADPTTGATVAEIAARWGFAKTGRFATVYRTEFGVPPSQTLRS